MDDFGWQQQKSRKQRKSNSVSEIRSPSITTGDNQSRSNYVRNRNDGPRNDNVSFEARILLKGNINKWMKFSLSGDIEQMISDKIKSLSFVIVGPLRKLWDCLFFQFQSIFPHIDTYKNGFELRNEAYLKINKDDQSDDTAAEYICEQHNFELRIISLDSKLKDITYGHNYRQYVVLLHAGLDYFLPLKPATVDNKHRFSSEEKNTMISLNDVKGKAVNRSNLEKDKKTLKKFRSMLRGMEKAEEIDKYYSLKASKDNGLRYNIHSPDQLDKMGNLIICKLKLPNAHSGIATPLVKPPEMKFKTIKLNNRRNCGYNAFENDQVYVKINDPVNQTGKVMGVHESTHKPVNSIYVCNVSRDQGTLMIPLNKFFPKIHVDNEPGRRHYEKNIKNYRVPRHIKNEQKSVVDREKESRDYADNLFFTVFKFSVNKPNNAINFHDHEVHTFNPETCEIFFIVIYERWDPHFLYPSGKIVGVLSTYDSLNDNFHLISSICNITPLEDTERIKREVSEIERKSKCSVTNNYIPPGAMVFTIDNETTTDMDDAISYHKEGNTIVIGVHISDVTKYISSTHELYQQALNRFCTTYPPKFCHIPPVHLFGDKLSTDVLSLVPNKPRAVVSVFFKFTEKRLSEEIKLNEIINHTFREGVIMSKYKLNYENVSYWLKQPDCPSDIDKDLYVALTETYKIARKLRRARLPESYFVQSTNEYVKDFDIKNQFEGEMLIEEFMLLANEYVAKKIYEIYPDFTLLRMQNRVNDHEEWIEELFRLTNMNFAAQLKDFCKLLNEKISSDGRDRGLVVSRRFFDKFSEFLSKEETVEKARNLLQYDDFYNDFYVHIIKWYEMSKPARYDCSVKDSVDNGHFSLAKSLYTHFTSPIRRFTDVIVHRLLKSVINGTEITDSSLDIHEVCDKANTRGRDNRIFEKLCAPYAIFNETNRKNCFILDCVCCEISNEEIKLVHPMLRKSSSERRIKFSDLSLDEVPLPFLRNDTNDKCSLKWRKIIFSCPPFDVGRRTFNKSQIDNHLFDCRLPSDCVKLFREIRRSYLSSKNLEAKLKELKNNFKYLEMDKIISSDSNSLVNPIINIGLDIFVKNTLRIQFSKYMKNGLQKICPELFIITPTFEICVIHKNDPVKFFISGGKLDLKHNDIIKRFQNVEEYKEYFRPLIHIESLTETLLDKSPFTLLSVPIVWIVGVSNKTRSIERYGVIKLAYKFCKSRNIIFNDENDDIIDRCEYIIHKGIHSVGGDLLCLRYFVENETKYWVGHGEIVRVGKFKSKSSDEFKVIVFRLTQCNFEFFPNPTEDIRYSADVYMKSIVSKRQEKAINSIDNIPLLKEIVLGSSELINKNIINAIHYNPRGKMNFKYNESQYKAIQKAMTFKLSLIWGPPGTGKTHVGCELSKAFCMKNGMRNLRGVVLYCGPSNDCVDLVSSDMKAKFIDNCPRMLRIYGEQQELIDFPLPGIFTKKENKLIGEMEEISLHHLIRRTGSNLAKEIDMYDKIFSDILSSANQNENRKNIHQDIYNIILAYKNVVKKAKIEYIENNRIEMVLCTTTVAASAIMKQFSILQVIVDEAGMCKEPETLIPISRAESTVENVVLIGDHKQLRPIIHSKVANKRGLQISLFERYQELKPESVTMLNNQYRMHPSICEFPSKQFYDGFLKTQISHRWSGLGKEVMREGCDYFNWNGVNYSQCQPHYEAILKTNHYDAIPNSKWPGQRKTKYVCFDFPFQVYPERLVFINVVGDEIIQSVSTITGNENSRGNRQEVEAVGHVYRKLIERLKPPRKAQDFVTVLTQYKLQQHLLHKKCKEILIHKKNEMDPDVKTVIRSQGSENEYIIFSTVRSLRNREDINNRPTPGWEKEYLGFITDANQVNVALTRARKGLIIIGNKNLLRVNHIWKELISDLENRKCVLDNYLEFPY